MEKKKMPAWLPGWIAAAIIAVGAGLAWLFRNIGNRSRNNNTNRRGILGGSEIIRDGKSGVAESQTRNKQAQQSAEKAGDHIDNAIESLDNATAILDRAKNRSKK